MGKRTTISAETKAKVALEAIRGLTTVNEIAVKHQIHPNMVTKWKKQATENPASIFADGRTKEKEKDDSKEKIELLYQEVGHLQCCLSRLKKNTIFTTEQKRRLINVKDRKISVIEQCRLLDLPRSSYYYEPQEPNETTLQIMREIDEEYTRHPFLGKRRICQYLQDRGCNIGVKQTRALMKQMGLISVVPGPHTSKPHPEHKKYPYLLKGLEIKGPNQVWTTDITYIRLSRGFVYLTAVFDWFSRYVTAWELSTTLDTEFCIRCVEEALRYGCPEIMNSDQGSQYTSREYIETLEKYQIQISMDGRGRAYDNIMIERFWRTIKCGEVYLKEYADVADCRRNLSEYIRYYNEERWHSTLNNTPMAVYTAKRSD